jgi:hypothetical protein
MFSITERPTGDQLEEFRKNLEIPGTATQQRQTLADSIGMPFDTYKMYVYETREAQMPAQAWAMLRITWEPLQHATWQREHQKRRRRE